MTPGKGGRGDWVPRVQTRHQAFSANALKRRTFIRQGMDRTIVKRAQTLPVGRAYRERQGCEPALGALRQPEQANVCKQNSLLAEDFLVTRRNKTK
ncbi:MAG: hypothetical protein AB1412_08695 [Pseudomonadota bacterium]